MRATHDGVGGNDDIQTEVRRRHRAGVDRRNRCGFGCRNGDVTGDGKRLVFDVALDVAARIVAHHQTAKRRGAHFRRTNLAGDRITDVGQVANVNQEPAITVGVVLISEVGLARLALKNVGLSGLALHAPPQ